LKARRLEGLMLHVVDQPSIRCPPPIMAMGAESRFTARTHVWKSSSRRLDSGGEAAQVDRELATVSGGALVTFQARL